MQTKSKPMPFFALFAAAMLIFACGASAAACADLDVLTAGVQINSCCDMSAGYAYFLTGSISNQASTCFTAVNNTIIDCQGNTIDGTKASNTYGVYSNNVQNVTVKNCIIRQFVNGIQLNYTHNGSFIDSTSYDHSSHAFDAKYSDYFSVRNNNLSKTNNGFWGGDGQNVFFTFTNNTLNGSVYPGIWFTGNHSVFANNTITFSTYSGITIDANSHNNTITNNTASSGVPAVGGTATDGIVVKDSSKNNTISFNNASLNFGSGIWLNNSASNNTVSNNVARNNTQYGIFIGYSSVNTTVSNNTAYANAKNGIFVNMSNTNTLSNNNASKNGENGINASRANSTVFTGNTANSNAQTGIVTYYSYNTVFSNNTANSNIANSGIRLEESSNNTVTGNTASSNAVFEGFTIIRTNNTAVTNNTAISNNEGIGVWFSRNDTVSNNTFYSNTANMGIMVYNSSNNTFAGNNASRNVHGIKAYTTSDNNAFVNNTANSNTLAGIYLLLAANSTVANNIANSNKFGFYVEGASNGTFQNNTANSNTQDGFLFTASLRQNVTNNTARSNSVNGMHVNSSSLPASNITDNVIYSNAQYGIYIYNSNGHTIAGNNATNHPKGFSGYAGIYASGNYMMITNNSVSNNSYGILNSGGSVTITNNNASQCDSGIATTSSASLIANNTANNNNQFGFYLNWGAIGNVVANNTATGNAESGLYTMAAYSNNYTNNNFSGTNFDLYIDTYYSLSEYFLNNTFNKSKFYASSLTIAIVAWYLRANVTHPANSSGISGVAVNVYDQGRTSGTANATGTTDAGGLTGWMPLTEYTYDGITYTYYTNYTVNATSGCATLARSHNLTATAVVNATLAGTTADIVAPANNSTIVRGARFIVSANETGSAGCIRNVTFNTTMNSTAFFQLANNTANGADYWNGSLLAPSGATTGYGTLWVHLRDASGTIQGTNYTSIFVDNATTSGSLKSASPYSAALGGSDYRLNITLNLSNAVSAQMQFANISYSSDLPAGWSLNATKYQCGAIAKGGYCNRTFQVTIPAGTAAGTKTIYWKGEWVDNDNSTHSPVLFNSTAVATSSSNALSVAYAANSSSITLINRTVNPVGAADLVQGSMNSSGNSALQNVSIYLVNTTAVYPYASLLLKNVSANGCTRNSAVNWSCSRICGGSGCDAVYDPSNIPFNFSVTVPWGTSSQNYLGTLNVTSANGGYAEIPVNLTVPNYTTWTIAPSTVNATFGLGETGSIGSIYVNNTGNVNLTFSVSCTNLPPISVNGTSCFGGPTLSVPKQTNQSVPLEWDGLAFSMDFYSNITLSSASATPSSNYTTVFANVSNRAPRVEYVVFSPAIGIVELGGSLNVSKANITDDTALSDALLRFQVTSPLGAAANYTPTRVSGSANDPQGNFSYSSLPTSTQGTYVMTIYSADNVGTYNASNHTYSVAGGTNVSVSANQSSFTISGITQDAGAWFLANVSFNNTGYAKAYYANASVDAANGWNYSYQNFSDNKNLSSGAFNTTLVNISIPAGAGAFQYSVVPTLSWKQANGSSASNTTVLSVTVASNPLLRFIGHSTEYTVYGGDSNSSQISLDAYGNTNVSSIDLSCAGSACTTFNITFNESSVSSISGGQQRAVLMTITVPTGTANNTYNVTINANSSGANASFAASIIVPPSSGWQFLPTSLALYRVGGSADNYSGITLRNNGNQNQSYTLSLSGNITSAASLNSSSISNLAGQSSTTTWLSLNVPNSTTTYSGFLVASNGTSEQNVSITVHAYVFSVVIASPTAASPSARLSAGQNLSMIARVLLGSNPVGSNTTFNASVSGQSCGVTSYDYSAGLWAVNCTAPSVSGTLSGDLNLTANYSLGPGWLVASKAETGAVKYSDSTPPQIGNSSLPAVDLGSGNTIQINMSDADAVAWTNLAVYSPAGTLLHSQNYSAANVSVSFNASQLSSATDYAVLLNSSDLTGNVNNTVVYFEVVDPKALSGTLTDAAGNALSATLYFKRPATGEVLVQNSTGAGGAYYARVGKRAYDFELALGDTRITLRNTTISASTTTLLSADSVPATAATIAGSSPVKVYAAEPAITYSNATVNISYADSLSSIIYEGSLHLFKCADWNLGSRVCRATWSRISSASVDKTSHRVSADVSSFSAYAVVENYCGDNVCRPDLGETYSACASDCPATFNASPNVTVIEINQTVTTTIPGAATVSLSQYISQLEELRKNPSLSEDTRKAIDDLLDRLKKLKTDKDLTSDVLEEIRRVIQKAQEELGIGLASQNIYLELYAGESTITNAHIKNTLPAESNLQVRLRGEITRYATISKNSVILASNEETAFGITVAIPVETAPAVYFGELEIKNERGTIGIPINVRVLEPQEKVLDLKIRPLSEFAVPGQNVQVEVNMYNLGEAKRIDVDFKLQLLDESAENILNEYEETISLENQLAATKQLGVPQNAADGKYVLRAYAYYPDKYGKTREATNIDYVYVQRPLYALTIFGIPVSLILAVAVVLIASGAYFYYMKREAERRRRYLEKIDFTKLPAPGPRSGVLGKIAESNVRAFFELDRLSTHVLAAGATGSGKTVAAQVLVEEALKKGVSVVVFDPTAQWTGFLRPQKNKEMLDAYKEFNMGASEAQAFKGNIRVVASPDEQIDVKKLMRPGEITVFVLSKLKQTAPKAETSVKPVSVAAGLGGQKPPIQEKIAETVLGEPSEMEKFVSNSIKTIFDSNLEESKQLRLLLVYDEVHRLLPKFGGSGEGFRQIERAVREFRKWGVGLILVSQVLSDFVGEIKANIGTEIQLRTKYEGDLDRVRLKYGEDTMKSAVKASIGTGMVQNSDFNHGRPYFVTFRPLLHNITRLSDAELSQYEQYNQKIENFAVLVAKLKSAGVDVFDVELELDLARDKLKKGTFNIVDIYLESLQQKIKALELRAARK
ncbi:MAG: helicase HerA-like domain-containing protein [Candidatus Micrarchaeia archaeon]|jgi:parallel beta-helix repeat protein